jgi:hypothetical protein
MIGQHVCLVDLVFDTQADPNVAGMDSNHELDRILKTHNLF